MWPLLKTVRLELQTDSPRQRPSYLHETYQLRRLQLITPDDGHRRCSKHVEFRDRIKILETWCILLVIYRKVRAISQVLKCNTHTSDTPFIQTFGIKKSVYLFLGWISTRIMRIISQKCKNAPSAMCYDSRHSTSDVFLRNLIKRKHSSHTNLQRLFVQPIGQMHRYNPIRSFPAFQIFFSMGKKKWKEG